MRSLHQKQGPSRTSFKTVRSLRCWSRGIEAEGDLRKDGRDRKVQRRAHLARKDGCKACRTGKIRAGTSSVSQKVTITAVVVCQAGGFFSFFNPQSTATKVASCRTTGTDFSTDQIFDPRKTSTTLTAIKNCADAVIGCESSLINNSTAVKIRLITSTHDPKYQKANSYIYHLLIGKTLAVSTSTTEQTIETFFWTTTI
jgi:hypothetical protein